MNPIWNEHFEFIVEDAATQHLVVKVYDEDGVQASELIGCAQVMLKDLHPGEVKDVWLKLVKDLEFQRDRKDRGQVSFQFLGLLLIHNFPLSLFFSLTECMLMYITRFKDSHLIICNIVAL